MAVVGIDRYAAWPRLHNAVSDARGAVALFTRLGFELAAEPLIDAAATGAALRRLVADDLSRLGPDDSLVVFFAGHGYTRTHDLANAVVKTGYIIPVDGDAPGGLVASWVRLDSWLSDVARLPVKHVLVILDACYSGVALDAVVTWRGLGGDAPDDAPEGEALAHLRARQSRRVITSALEDQRALDNGPVPGHSLFTGCLIEGLTGGLAQGGKREATGSELGQYLQRRVTTFPGSQQTPDFGALELDDRGELVLPVLLDPHHVVTPARPRGIASRSSLLLAGAAAAALLAVLWRFWPGRDPGDAPAPLPTADAALLASDAAPLDSALPAPDAGLEAPADATLAFADASLLAAPDATRAPTDGPPSSQLRKPRCWVPRDDVHATPQPCSGARCPGSCIDATSDDAPVRVPRSAFAPCTEVWICE